MSSSKLLLVTDAWHPQTNGVVTMLTRLTEVLREHLIQTTVIHPGDFRTYALPRYPEISLSVDPWRISSAIAKAEPEFVHIATEGPLGVAARKYCLNRNLPYTTALHTNFPFYVKKLFHVPSNLTERYLRWFHNFATLSVVQSEGQKQELESKGLRNLIVVGGGVDTTRFRPQPHTQRARPTLLFVGRVSKEKNIEAFLDLPIDAEKIVVGDGPFRETLEKQYPQVTFKGYKRDDELIAEFAQADCLVFPSRSDTFGLVILEAVACGTPVAAYPVTGPNDLIKNGVNGALSEDLGIAVENALKVDRSTCRDSALAFDWQRAGEKFVSVLEQSRIHV